MAPRERRSESGGLQKFSKGSSAAAAAKQEKKAKKKEEKAAKKEALKRQKEKDAKVKKKEAAKAGGNKGLLARLFAKPEVEEGTPTDPDWIPADETEGPKKGSGKLSSFFESLSKPGKKQEKPAKEAEEEPKETAEKEAEKKEEKEKKEEEKKEDKGKGMYEEVLAEKDASAHEGLKSEGHFCLGIVDKNIELPSPDDAPWAFKRPWHVAFLLAHRIPEKDRDFLDRQTDGWLFLEPPSGCTLRIGQTEKQLLAPERAFVAEATLRWQEGIDSVLVIAKAEDKEFRGKVKLPKTKKDAHPSGIVILVNEDTYTREEA